MSEEVGFETEVNTRKEKEGGNEQAFLKSSETANLIIGGLNIQGFQLGGGAVDFVLGEYRRPHSDIDMVYVVETRNWQEYIKEPWRIPDERCGLQAAVQEPELFGVKQAIPIAMEKMGAPGVQMQEGELPLVVDFIEAYQNAEEKEEYIMLPVYEGSSYIKIPKSEILEKEIDGITVRVPSVEMQLVLREQCASFFESLKGGLPPDRRKKSAKDIKDLRRHADMKKVQELKNKKAGFNYSLLSSFRYKTARILQSLAS